MQAFWKSGYDGTGMEDLLRATEIGRQSLYNKFGDKRALFLRCLRHYHETRTQALREFFAEQRPVRAAFARLFEGAVTQGDERKRLGCLTLNTVMEMVSKDVEIADLLARHQRRLEDVFVEAIEAGVRRGELPRSFDARAAGRFLVGVFFGLTALAKGDPSSPALADTARLSLKIFDT